MVFACKKCKKVFRKNLKEFDEADEYCPGCDNHYYIEAKEEEKKVVIMAKHDDQRVKTVEEDLDAEWDGKLDGQAAR